MRALLTVLQSAEYWIVPAVVFGAIVGSFLNVVIFRVPRGLSIMQPRWSFCPHCSERIRPWHNVPVLGWLILRGRCHDCRVPISAIYATIECATALMFVMIWDVLFVAGAVPGVGSVAGDWPLAIAYLGLFASLLATAAMDIESYTIDIRLSVFAMILGVACHALRGMPTAAAVEAGMLPPALCLGGVAMGAIWLVTLWFALRRAPSPHDERPEAELPEQATAYLDSSDRPFSPWAILASAAVIAVLTAWQLIAPERPGGLPVEPWMLRGIAAAILFMALLVSASVITREADEQIIEEIEAERHEARPMALREFAWLLPALTTGVALFVFFRMTGRVDDTFARLVGEANPDAAWIGHVAAGCQSIAGLVFGAALGWGVRILGTLAFGKEAFGTGDIYIMAAIGAVAGFWAVLFTLFVASMLAIVGILLTRFWKQSRAVPFGPWLALGAFVGLWLNGFLLNHFGPVGRLLWDFLIGQPLWPPAG